MSLHSSKKLRTFSLILATVNRVNEVDNFLKSIMEVNYPLELIEVLIVDQNADNRLSFLVEKYKEIRIIHLKSKKGLSRSRNIGLQSCTGDIICFPDDDCWYTPHLLEKIIKVFESNKDAACVTGRCVDEDGRESVSVFPKLGKELDFGDIFSGAVSITIFMKKEAQAIVGEFDENLGAGSDGIFGSGEEPDYLLRCSSHDLKIYYDPEIVVGHPNISEMSYADVISRTIRYSPGIGYLFAKHSPNAMFTILRITRPLLGMFYSLATFEKRQFSIRYHRLIYSIRGYYAAKRIISRHNMSQ